MCRAICMKVPHHLCHNCMPLLVWCKRSCWCKQISLAELEWKFIYSSKIWLSCHFHVAYGIHFMQYFIWNYFNHLEILNSFLACRLDKNDNRLYLNSRLSRISDTKKLQMSRSYLETWHMKKSEALSLLLSHSCIVDWWVSFFFF